MHLEQLLKASEVAKVLNEHKTKGIKWYTQLIHEWVRVGKFPKPYTHVGKQRLWKISQIEAYEKGEFIEEHEEDVVFKASQVAEIMGGNWDRKYVHEYLKRKKLPEPAMMIGKQPLWTKEQIDHFIEKRGR